MREHLRIRIDQRDRRVAIVLLTAAVALTINNFAADDARWLITSLDALGLNAVAARLNESMFLSSHKEANDLTFWATVQIASYVFPPLLVIRYIFRDSIRDFGVRVRGSVRFAPTYAALFVVCLPFLIFVSTTVEFQARYPFLEFNENDPLGPLLFWWVLYALQFCALEFFFRGFMVHGLSERFGISAVFVMAVPYNMLHYGKPMLEAVAAILGAIVLGVLAIRSRTIWWGACLHIAVAGTMDLLSLHQRGIL